jgi:SAM-dependent methyltransferase
MSTTTETERALARCYDLDMLDVAYDAELYLHLAQQADDGVLELGVGSGRLAVPLAIAGHRVVGVDIDPAMLERAQAAWDRAHGAIDRARLRLVPGDLATYRSAERFGLVFLAVNTFLLAPDDAARRRVLETMRMHLRPGGIAAIEMSTPDAEELGGYDGRSRREWTRRDPETGVDVEKRIAARYEAASHSVTLRQDFSWTTEDGTGSTVSRVDTLHLIEPVELADLALGSGFAEVETWGDHLAIPYGAGSHRAIIVARLL